MSFIKEENKRGEDRLSSGRVALFAALLVAASFIVRLFHISRGPYHADCLLLALKAQDMVQTGQFYYLHGSGHPLTALFGAGFVLLSKLFSIQDPVWVVNFMSVCLSSLSVGLFFVLAKKLFDVGAAIFSSLLFSFHPVFWSISEFGNSHTVSLFFFLLGLCFLFHSREKASLVFFYGAAICFGLMGAARLQDLVAVFIPVSVLVINGRIKDERPTSNNPIRCSVLNVPLIKRIRPFFFWLIASGVLFGFYSPLLNAILSVPAYHPPEIVPYMFKSLTTLYPWAYQLSAQYLWISFSFLGCLLWAGGFILFLREPAYRRWRPFFILWVVVPFLLFGNVRSTVPRFFLVMIIPLCLLQGYLLSALTRKGRWVKMSALFLFLFTLLITTQRIYPLILFRHENKLLADYYKWAGTMTEPNAVIINRDNEYFVRYYARRKSILPEIGLMATSPDVLPNLEKEISALLAEGTPVYCTSAALLGFRGGFEEMMRRKHEITLVGSNWVEVWYRGCLFQDIGRRKLYRVTKMKRR